MSNRLRSFLTLLGISIGIFCVIAVLSSVDSLEQSLVDSFEKLGTDVLYVDKFPWQEDPGQNFGNIRQGQHPMRKTFGLSRRDH
ncbi:MAG: ABC transporter permease [Saprospiraceae bacterium]|nr:ABC transporter permease [Saprospiraceae bacterium]